MPLVVGPRLDHDAAAVLQPAHRPPAGEHHGGVGRAVAHHDLEGGDTRAGDGADALDLTGDLHLLAQLDIAHLGDAGLGELLLKSLLVEVLRVGRPTLLQIPQAHDNPIYRWPRSIQRP